MTSLDKNKVILGMSGGVDSSVTAILLKEQGYAITGVSLNLYNCDRPLGKGCCTPADRLDARKICERLEFPFAIVDVRSRFKTAVIDYFAEEYLQGRTPLPCAPCNRDVRFQALLEQADAQGAYWIATGHYARVEDSNGTRALLRGVDSKKDQSYFLFGLGEDILQRLLLPIGGYRKEEVRQLAKVWHLPVHDKPDSQELCFLSGEDHSHFIRENYSERTIAPGDFVDREGRVLGKHRGLPAYTIGQRRGVEVNAGRRLYVTALDPSANRIVLGSKESLMAKGLVATGVQPPLNLRGGDRGSYTVKIRSTHPGVGATLQCDADTVTVHFSEPQMAVTPGQAAVFYQGEKLIGGGWIHQALC